MEDWAAMAAVAKLKRVMGKGDKHRVEVIERLREIGLAVQRQRRKVRGEAARMSAEPPVLKRPENWRGVVSRRGGRVRDFMLADMEPGSWYGNPDLVALMAARGIPVGSVKMTKVRLLSAGLIERTKNPEFKPEHEGLNHFRGSDFVEPRYLYRLTQRGEQERAEGWWF
jgi:hypothetical protein